MSTINLDITYRGFRSHYLHSINLFLLCGSGFIAVFLLITFLPVPSDVIYSTSILSPERRLKGLAITGVILICSGLIAKWNSIIKYGKIEIEQQQLSFITKKRVKAFSINEIRSIELIANRDLILRSTMKVYSFKIEGYADIKALNMQLYKLKDKIDIKIHD